MKFPDGYRRLITIEIHGFSDASEVAYSAVVYVRSRDANQRYTVSLVAAKTKVAPTSKISLPKLELCGALLLSNLLKKIVPLFTNVVITRAWTDSTIVLAWLSDCPRKWKTFVANRTAKILQVIPREHWSHVPTLDNPADCASRGIIPGELISHPLWWNGPTWLAEESNKWPILPLYVQSEIVLPEARALVVQQKSEIVEEENEFLSKFLSVRTTIRVLAYVFRFINNSRRRSSREINLLTTRELQKAEQACVKLSQRFCFMSEIHDLTKGQPVKSNS